MHEIFESMRNNTLDSVIQRIDRNEWTNNTTRRNNYRVFARHLKENNQAFKNARNLAVYYKISKAITPNDVTFRVNSDTTFRGYEASQDYKTAVIKMMEWYVSHVATYQHKHNNGNYTNGSVEAEQYYIDKEIGNYVTIDNTLTNGNTWYTNYYGRGRYYCQAYTERMKNTHQWVGDDCSGFMMAVIGYYAGDSLKNKEYLYLTEKSGKKWYFDINSIGTSTVGDYTNHFATWVASQSQIYVYQVTRNTTLNDLEFGDFLIATEGSKKASGGHAEMYIDANHTWGWGMKHCKMFDMDGNLGWKGYFTKTNTDNYFKWYRKDITRDNNQNTEAETYYCEERQYKYVISPNPNKRNMTPKFRVEG